MRVLIVDDSREMRRALVKLVTREGHEVVGEAENGEQGVLAYEKLRPDMVILDNRMPVMTGLAALRVIRASHPDARIIMCSSDDVRNEALASGAVAYLRKPIAPHELTTMLQEVAASIKS